MLLNQDCVKGDLHTVLFFSYNEQFRFNTYKILTDLIQHVTSNLFNHLKQGALHGKFQFFVM